MRLFTRNGHDWTGRFPLIARAALSLKAASCLIDGEAVACDDNGLPVFDDCATGATKRVLLQRLEELWGADAYGQLNVFLVVVVKQITPWHLADSKRHHASGSS